MPLAATQDHMFQVELEPSAFIGELGGHLVAEVADWLLDVALRS
jgi:hypothetical protein